MCLNQRSRRSRRRRSRTEEEEEDKGGGQRRRRNRNRKEEEKDKDGGGGREGQRRKRRRGTVPFFWSAQTSLTCSSSFYEDETKPGRKTVESKCVSVLPLHHTHQPQ